MFHVKHTSRRQQRRHTWKGYFKMLYTLYYQKRCGDTVIITRSKSLLKLLKIKFVTYGLDTRAFIAVGGERFNKFDLIGYERLSFNDFEIKVNAGHYFPAYDYSHRARKKCLETL